MSARVRSRTMAFAAASAMLVATVLLAAPAPAATGTSKTHGVAIPFAPDSFHNDYTRCYHLPPPYPDGKNHCTAQQHSGGDPGNDYSMDAGTKLYAIFGGTLSCENKGSDSWGLRAFLLLSNGWTIGYGHLSKMASISSKCTKKVHVKAGALIAYSGNSGLSTGAHVEIQLMDPDTSVGKGGQGLVDPRALLVALYRADGKRAPGGRMPKAHRCLIWTKEFDRKLWEARYEGFPMKSPPACPD